jgi:hypothetical protein
LIIPHILKSGGPQNFNFPMSRCTRCLLYSHHIRARSKIKTISSLSDRFNVDGIFKIGRPGYIYVDGDESGVHEAIISLKVFLKGIKL